MPHATYGGEYLFWHLRSRKVLADMKQSKPASGKNMYTKNMNIVTQEMN